MRTSPNFVFIACLIIFSTPASGEELKATFNPTTNISAALSEPGTSIKAAQAQWSHHLRTQAHYSERELTIMERAVKRCWFPPRNCESKVVTIGFDLGDGKTVSGLHVENGSGDGQADEAACYAIRNASPFALDDKKSGWVQFIFDYDLYKFGSENFHQWWQ